MIVLSWNCRGLSSLSAIPNLRNIAQRHRPDILFLSETLVNSRRMETVRTRLKFDSCLSIDVEGRSGGIAVLWRDNIKCTVMNYSRNFVNLLIEDDTRGDWRLTCYYGYPERNRRQQAWDMLRSLRDMSNLPWCVIGDFNDLLSQEDKRGLILHPNYLYTGFRKAVEESDLVDIRLEGYQFTWSKSRGTPRMIEERLDRAMANPNWFNLFPNVTLLNSVSSHSDHNPIVLHCDPVQKVGYRYVFKFENQWLLEDDIKNTVDYGWNNNSGHELVDRIGGCAKELQRWSRRKRTRFKADVNDCEAEMEHLRGLDDEYSIARLMEIERRHKHLLNKEEMYWKQRAKMHWFKDGYLNTKFFHMTATARRNFKKILMLVDEQGSEIRDQNGISTVAANYFRKLFQAQQGNHDNMLQLIQPCITDEDNERLTAPISKAELFEALRHMHPDKAPGHDGFNPAFYQHFWDICGDDIFEAVSLWLTRGVFPGNLNDTNICLIPKCDNPSDMRDLRPISLCNVVYKMVSKLLANRLKSCLAKCVSEEQSAFVEGRSIIDNSLIAFEIIHKLKRKNRGNIAELALKIDISKAYDRVDWSFLIGVLRRLGFTEKWVHWMMMCVTSVNYSVMVNSDSIGPIQPERGLRANLSEVRQLMDILKVYADAAGQEINMNKSEVFFSRNISHQAQEDLSRIMGVRHVLGTGTYLGLPSMIGRRKRATFSYVKDRIWKRIHSWRGRPMSRAGKEVMIKSVLQAIPAYIMSVFILPDSLVSEIERMLNAFWWGGGNNNKGIRWLAWESLTYPKNEGGLGFRDFKAFNMAMVAKQSWNIMTKQDTLVAKVFKAKYYPNSSFLQAKLGNNPSFVWRSIWKAKDVLSVGCRWRIGDGSQVRVMSDPWLRSESGSMIEGPQGQQLYSLVVKDLMHPNIKQWDHNRISTLLSTKVANSIFQVPLLEDVKEDGVIWKAERNGCYSVKTGYRLWLQECRKFKGKEVDGDWRGLWSIQAPPKTKHLLWRICRGCLPTRNTLRQHFVLCPSNCHLCDEGNEDEMHIFFNCAHLSNCWTIAGLEEIIRPRLMRMNNAKLIILDICSKEDKKVAGRVAVMLWEIWNNRNNWIWNNEKRDANQMGTQGYHMWHDWFKAQDVYEMDDTYDHQTSHLNI